MNELFLAFLAILYIIIIAAMCWSSANSFPKDDEFDSFIQKNTKRYKERSNDTKND
jgi:uncharacterized protein YxeA